MSTLPGRDAPGIPELSGVSTTVAKQASEFFRRGGSFFIYTDKTSVWRGRNTVGGWIRYIKNPHSRRITVKVCAFTEVTDVHGKRQRIGVVCDPAPCVNSQGKVQVIYSASGQGNSMSRTTAAKLSGKAPLHVALYPATLSTRAVSHGLPAGAISNELLIPIEF